MHPQEIHRLKTAAAHVVQEAFSQEALHRGNRSVEEWCNAEIQAVLKAARRFALEHGLKEPALDDVARSERSARGHCDYSSKWALYVAEDLLKTVQGPRGNHG